MPRQKAISRACPLRHRAHFRRAALYPDRQEQSRRRTACRQPESRNMRHAERRLAARIRRACHGRQNGSTRFHAECLPRAQSALHARIHGGALLPQRDGGVFLLHKAAGGSELLICTELKNAFGTIPKAFSYCPLILTSSWLNGMVMPFLSNAVLTFSSIYALTVQ